jgi:hypothetical protein
VADRYFTAEEASELLPAVRRLAQRMVRQRRKLTRALERQEQLRGVIGSNGGGIGPQEAAEAQAQVERAAEGIARAIEAIHELGALVKDVDRGLIDFPALREGEEVLLCWQLGEDEIRYWHGVDEGFAGRRELPL